jgi:hypothetical protein
MKIRLITILGIITLITQLAYPQKFRKGFIVKINNDTIHGFIFDKTDSELSNTIAFSTDPGNGHQITYTVNDLSGFGFMNNRIFERITFIDSIADTVKVFAKKVIEGKIRMFLWRRNSWDKFDFFLFNSNPEISVHLTEPVKKVEKDERGVEQTYEKISHIGLLKNVKNDTLKTIKKNDRIRYSEKAITNNIVEYDKQFVAGYPLKTYKEERRYFFDITLGYPILWGAGGTNFRAAIYSNRYLPERNRMFSLMAGISYRFWKSNEPVENIAENDNLNYKQQWITLIPIGIQFRSDKKIVRPYFYTGIGMQLFVSGNYQYIIGNALETKNELRVLPAVNIGAGIKIKTGTNFLAIEITPSGNGSGIFANIGFSF